ncbi:MAG TPA: FAD-dependent oxidoreductase [bacterium]|nr:FAD-dependent oxidoreductase [bacterium]
MPNRRPAATGTRPRVSPPSPRTNKSDGSAGIVIIGNSAAGIAAIEAIRRQDAAVPVTVISREAGNAYSRPFIIHQHDKPQALAYRDAAFYRRHRVTLVHATADRIDPQAKTVAAGRRVFRYTRLLLAVGGTPVRPPIPGLDLPQVHTLTTLADAQRIQQAVRRGCRAVIIGCGMIGIKAAEYLAGLGAQVTIVELQERPFAAVLDAASGTMVTEQLRRHATLLLGDSVARITATQCVLQSGTELPADLVVCAIGVVPDLALAAGAKLRTARGILVDEQQRTSQRDIFAAGDCAAAMDLLAGERRPLPVWPIAFRQGTVAGTVMAGGTAAYAGGFLLNSVSVFGMPLITLGLSTLPAGAGVEELVPAEPQRGTYKKIILRDGKIVGAILVGDIDRAGIITGIMSDGICVEPFKHDLLRDEFGYIYVPKEFRSREVEPTEV